jgi:hypothetical protein
LRDTRTTTIEVEFALTPALSQGAREPLFSLSPTRKPFFSLSPWERAGVRVLV